MANGPWPCPMAMANGHGHSPWSLAMIRGRENSAFAFGSNIFKFQAGWYEAEFGSRVMISGHPLGRSAWRFEMSTNAASTCLKFILRSNEIQKFRWKKDEHEHNQQQQTRNTRGTTTEQKQNRRNKHGTITPSKYNTHKTQARQQYNEHALTT